MEVFDVTTLDSSSISELQKVAANIQIKNTLGLRKQDLIDKILKKQSKDIGNLFDEGVLEILPDGFGFLRSPNYNYLPGQDDIYIAPSQIKRFSLRKGDTVFGQIRPPKEGEKLLALLQVHSINGENLSLVKQRVLFDNLTPLYPKEKIN